MPVQKKRAKMRFGTAVDQMNLYRGHGAEPTWDNVNITDEDYDIRLAKALNWATAAFDTKMLKTITIDYLSDKKEYAYLNEVSAEWFYFIGKLAWLKSNNAPLREITEQLFSQELEKIKIKYDETVAEKEKEQDVKSEEKKLTPEQLAKIEYVNLYSAIDNMIVNKDFYADKIYELIRNRTPSGLAISMLAAHYEENIDDCDHIENAKKIPSGIVRMYLKNLRTNSAEVVQQIAKILKNVKAEKKLDKIRRPRKKKIKPANMQVKKLQFKESDTKLKLVSIPPTSVVNAEVLITFNTKTRKVAVFYAKNTDGLSVKGTTIVNFDTDKSQQKTIRKPEEMIEHLIESTLKRFEKVFEGIKAKTNVPKGRINSDTLLLKTFKVR